MCNPDHMELEQVFIIFISMVKIIHPNYKFMWKLGVLLTASTLSFFFKRQIIVLLLWPKFQEDLVDSHKLTPPPAPPTPRTIGQEAEIVFPTLSQGRS